MMMIADPLHTNITNIAVACRRVPSPSLSGSRWYSKVSIRLIKIHWIFTAHLSAARWCDGGSKQCPMYSSFYSGYSVPNTGRSHTNRCRRIHTGSPSFAESMKRINNNTPLTILHSQRNQTAPQRVAFGLDTKLPTLLSPFYCVPPESPRVVAAFDPDSSRWKISLSRSKRSSRGFKEGIYSFWVLCKQKTDDFRQEPEG